MEKVGENLISWLEEESTNEPASEDVMNESVALYRQHIMREIIERGFALPSNLSFNEGVVSQEHLNLLRSLANRFIHTPQRQWVREQAQHVQLETLNFGNFQNLLIGLFQEGGVTWERILVLFYFCTDLLIRVIEEKVVKCFSKIYEWSVYYIRVYLSSRVEREGGWRSVLNQSVHQLAQFSMLTFCCVAIVALSIYIKKNMH